MISRSILFILFIGASIFCGGQTSNTTPSLDNSLIPPSPEAGSMGKYGILPVTLYTGIPNVSVPVFDIRTTKLSLPVSLAYNYNGYRPGELSSSVGMGWNLEGGGVITRVVKGLPDDDLPLNTSATAWDAYANVDDLTINMDFMQALGTGVADGEPDLYLFHFNGHSGKFIMVGGRAYTFPRQKLKIVQTSGLFSITDEDGTVYQFNLPEITTTKGPSNIPGPYNSSWYLTSITSADQTDVISFQYTGYYGPQDNNGYTDTYQVDGNGFNCNGTNAGCDLFSTTSSAVQFTKTLRLRQISFNGGNIQFIPEATARQDLGTDTALGEIDIYNSNFIIRKMVLQHTYFQGSLSDAGGGSGATQLRLDGVETRGYYSNTVTDTVAFTKQTPQQDYSFQYANETASDFPRDTRGIDYFGYYNGVHNNTSLFTSVITSYTSYYANANRGSDPTRSMNGALTKITYPTGGYTNFTYEGNMIDFDVSGSSSTSYCYPIGVYPTATYTGTGNTMITTYGSFTVDACLYSTPAPVNVEFGQNVPGDPDIKDLYNILTITSATTGKVYWPPNPGGYALGYNTDFKTTLDLPADTYNYTVTCTNDPTEQHPTSTFANITNITYFDQAQYDYDQQYGFPGPGIRVKTITSYDNINSSPALTRSYTYPSAVLLGQVGLKQHSVYHNQDNGGTETIFSSNFSSPLSSLLDDQYYYPTVTELTDATGANGKTIYQYGGGVSQNEVLGIQLLGRADYGLSAGAYIPLKVTTNTYSYHKLMDFYAVTADLREVAGNKGGYVPPLPDDPDPYDLTQRYNLYTATPYYLESGWDQLDSKQDITYDQNGQNPVSSTTSYYYDDPDYLQPSRVVTQNSKGELITTQYMYPADYGLTGVPTLSSTDLAYYNARTSASSTYQGCVVTRDDQANLVWTPPQTGNSTNTALQTVWANNPCESQYAGASSTAVGSMNTAAAGYYTGYAPGTAPHEGIELMMDQNICTRPIEVIESINKGGTDYLLSAMRTDYVPNPNASTPALGLYEAVPSTAYHAPENASNVLKSDFMANPSAYYVPRVYFTYDNNCNLIGQNKANDLSYSYLWDYGYAYPVAQVKNSVQGSIAYTSFESDGKGNWSYSGTPIADASSPTGNNCYNVGGSTTITTAIPLNPSTIYRVSYWTKLTYPFPITGTMTGYPIKGKTINGWTYFEHRVTGQSSVSIVNAGKIDELRLYPEGAQMTTYTYRQLVGMTTDCDVNNKVTYYQYDAFGRLNVVRDQDTNIIKKICYNYAGQPTNCNVSTFYNVADTAYFTKNNCGADSTGSAVPFIVPAGTYASGVSQAAADQAAQNYIDSSGQAYANSSGSCMLSGNVTVIYMVPVMVQVKAPLIPPVPLGTVFTVTYTNLGTHQQYSFQLPESITPGAPVYPPVLGTIPAGSYDLNISSAGNTTAYVFGSGCSKAMTTSGTSATFYNIQVTANDCYTVSVGNIIY